MRQLDKLTDAQKMAQRYPDFEAPSDADLDSISPGDVVKICRNRERFWVLVHSVDGNAITGEVNNYLIMNDMPVGTVIKFAKRHVFQTVEVH